MEVSTDLIEEIAPDQSSITAAKKLLNSNKWPVLEQSTQMKLIWGECQGSGSKPYYTTADVDDHGYKCTCPSRKFPCKHVLALFWKYADGADEFSEADVPQWVTDWLGRRRKKNVSADADQKDESSTDGEQSVDGEQSTDKKNSKPKLSIDATPAEPKLTAEELAKREADRIKRAEQTRQKTKASVEQGIKELQQWINDQLTQGVINFLKDSHDRCKQISVRLVDAKAANLAARVDEFPAKLAGRSMDEQINIAMQELSKLALLTRAWQANSDDIDVYRTIVATEDRDQLLNNPEAIKVQGMWQVIGEKTEMRKNGLLAHSRWVALLQEATLDQDSANINTPKVALLLDYIPQATKKTKVTETLGLVFCGDVIFYPSISPERAILGEHEYIKNDDVIKACKEEIQPQLNDALWREAFTQTQKLLPWAETIPFIGGSSRILSDESGLLWWRNEKTQEVLPLINSSLDPLILTSQLNSILLLTDGQYGELISVDSKHWGVLSCQ